MNRRAFLPLVALACASPLLSQSRSIVLGPHRMELTLERKTTSGWKVVDPGFIFDGGDLVRFRFRTNFSGFVYVMNQGTGGSYMKLFPREDTGLMNRLVANKEYVVPATDGAFRVDGPAGQDIMHWMMMPVSMGGEKHSPTRLPPPPPAPVKDLGTMTPRCDDTVLRARGDCVDTSAGPQALAQTAQVPENLKELAQKNDQELVFVKKQNTTVVSSPVPLNGPVVFEFRLAHK
jgi:hypothetical protein